MIALLVVYSGLVLAAVFSGCLLWQMRKAGAVLNLGLLPVEAVFWVGFALPLPWLFGIARVALVTLVWPELSGSRVGRLPRLQEGIGRRGEPRAASPPRTGPTRRGRRNGEGARGTDVPRTGARPSRRTVVFH